MFVHPTTPSLSDITKLVVTMEKIKRPEGVAFDHQNGSKPGVYWCFWKKEGEDEDVVEGYPAVCIFLEDKVTKIGITMCTEHSYHDPHYPGVQTVNSFATIAIDKDTDWDSIKTNMQGLLGSVKG